MYSAPSKRSQLIRQTAIYIAMTMTVVVVVFLLILFILGYRLNRATGTLEQGGLVQFNSIPNGAVVEVDSTKLGTTTGSKATLAAGTHTVTMSRSGYHTWRKTVDVKSGTILWLNYARLIPTDLKVENVADLPAVTSSIASPSRRWLAFTTEPTAPSVMLADIGGDAPELKTLTLPEDIYTVSEDKTGEVFRLAEWDPSSRYLLVQHQYVDKTEWIVVDTQNVASSKNLTKLFDVPMTGAKFSNSNSRVLYALMNGDIRKVDIDAATISAPLVRHVAEFSLYDRSMLTYVTVLNPDTKKRDVGYYQEGAAQPRVIRSYSDDGATPLHLSLGKYYGDTYVGIAYGDTVDILTGSLPRSDSGDSSTLTAFATMTVPGGVDYLSNKTDGRFFAIQSGASYSVYDLELRKFTTTPLSAKPDGELRWIDGYMVWSSFGGMLRLYEFDGTNQHDIMPIIPGQNPTLTSNNRYIYAPTVDDKGAVHLSRVRLVL